MLQCQRFGFDGGLFSEVFVAIEARFVQTHKVIFDTTSKLLVILLASVTFGIFPNGIQAANKMEACGTAMTATTRWQLEISSRQSKGLLYKDYTKQRITLLLDCLRLPDIVSEGHCVFFILIYRVFFLSSNFPAEIYYYTMVPKQ